jgi:thiamine-monophosphate kinase
MTQQTLTSEADLIELLAPLTAGAAGAFGLTDDCAYLSPRPGYDLVLKTDPVRAGVHFFSDDPPDAIAWKALAVNMSDLAAKGAEPLAYLMAMSFPEPPTRAWAVKFIEGLRDAQRAFNCHLIGGDTDRSPGPLSISITAIGDVPAGTMVRRATARAGDAIFVSGTIGDSGLALRLHKEAREGRRTSQEQWKLSDEHVNHLIARYLRPQPRLELAALVRAHASASMDLSDGLIKDLERMCKASGVGADIRADAVPLSAAARAVLAVDPHALPTFLTAGDDYEILAAVPRASAASFEGKAAGTRTGMHRIGTFVDRKGVAATGTDGAVLRFDCSGWDHF